MGKRQPNRARKSRARVARGEDGASLLDIVSDRLGVSRSAAKRVIDGRHVFVNGSRVWMAKHRVAAGDTVDMAPPPAPANDKTKVLWADRWYLVVDKPPGCASDGRNGMEARVRAEAGFDTAVLCHRLDRDTSGCLLLARSEEAKQAVIPRFKAREVTKEYRAVVRGRLRQRDLAIDTPLDGRTARTRIRSLRGNDVATHIAVWIETGRTHQIRRHLAMIRHPVVGDAEHGPTTETVAVLREIPRQLLHARRLAFAHPETGRKVDVSAPLPADYRRALKALF